MPIQLEAQPRCTALGLRKLIAEGLESGRLLVLHKPEPESLRFKCMYSIPAVYISLTALPVVIDHFSPPYL